MATTPTAGTGSGTPAAMQTFAEIVKADFLLVGAFLLFLGLISTDAYYRAFGLRFQFLTYPWNLIIFRGLLTVVRYPWLWLLLLVIVVLFQVDRGLSRNTTFSHHSWRIAVGYILTVIVAASLPALGTYIGADEATKDMQWTATTLPKITRIAGDDGQQECPQCLLLLMDSSQVVYFGALNKGEKDVLPQTKIRARASITSLDTTR
jgi:hypothetical protein